MCNYCFASASCYSSINYAYLMINILVAVVCNFTSFWRRDKRQDFSADLPRLFLRRYLIKTAVVLISFVVADALLPEASRPLVSISERKGERESGSCKWWQWFHKVSPQFLRMKAIFCSEVWSFSPPILIVFYHDILFITLM